MMFGQRIGISEKRIRRHIRIFQEYCEKVRVLILNSILSQMAKATYLACYESKLQRLNYAYN